MYALIEYTCQTHGLERIRVPLLRNHNLSAQTLAVLYRENYRDRFVKAVKLGRERTDQEAVNLLRSLLENIGLTQVKIQLVKSC